MKKLYKEKCDQKLSWSYSYKKQAFEKVALSFDRHIHDIKQYSYNIHSAPASCFSTTDGCEFNGLIITHNLESTHWSAHRAGIYHEIHRHLS